MPLTISTRNSEEIEILDLNGDLVFGAEDLAFRNALDDTIRGAKTRIIVNLTNVHQLDSTGIATLIDSLSRLRKLGGNLAVFNPKPMHVRVLVDAKLEAAFELFPTEKDAINSFFPDRKIEHYDILAFVESLNHKDATVGSQDASKTA